MNYAQAILLALFSAVAVGCVEGLQEVYELQDTRILGMQANPPELALTSEGTQVVTVKPFVYLPEGRDDYLHSVDFLSLRRRRRVGLPMFS